MELTSEENQFNEFKAAFNEYQHKFGLFNYRIMFVMDTSPSGDNATITTWREESCAKVAFYPKSDMERFESDRDIREVAKHEAIHLLLADMSDIAESRFASMDDLRSAEEALVHRLEKLIPE